MILDLDEVQAYFAKLKSYKFEYIGRKTAAWHFRVSPTKGSRSTDVLVPFVVDGRSLPHIVAEVDKFFKFFGGK